MHLRRTLVLPLLLTALGGCNNDNIQNSNIGLARFQIAVGSTETFLVDGATGDLWKLNENPGDEPGEWVRYADGPGDAKPLAQILHPDEAASEPPAEEQKDEQPEGEDRENQDG